MTVPTVMDKDRLAAFVDGELSPEEAAEIVIHLADHPGDQVYVDDLMAANEALAQAFDAPLQEPVPDPIREAIMKSPQADTVVPFRRRPVAVVSAGLALAASVALAAVLLPELQRGSPERIVALGPVPQGSQLNDMLGTLSSGVPVTLDGGEDVMILATLPVENGFCRELEVVDAAKDRLDFGIACHDSDGWTVEVMLSELLSNADLEDGFVTASGAEVRSLQPFLERLGAGPALDAKAEAEAMAQGWVR